MDKFIKQLKSFKNDIIVNLSLLDHEKLSPDVAMRNICESAMIYNETTGDLIMDYMEEIEDLKDAENGKISYGNVYYNSKLLLESVNKFIRRNKNEIVIKVRF